VWWETSVLLYYQQIGHPDRKNNQQTLELNDTTDEMDLTDIYRGFHPGTAQYIFSSAAHGTFVKVDHILGLNIKAIFNKYKKIEITPYLLSDHNTIKLELKKKRKQKILRHLETEQHITP
jgi:hypothetical protein